MDESVLPSGRVGVGVVVALAAAASFLAAFWFLAVSADGSAGHLFVAALAVPLLAVFAPLFYVGREVASRPDDPDEVGSRLADGLGLTKAEFDRRAEGEGKRHVHPDEREFED